MSREKLPYVSFFWKLGTTSFRTRQFNKMTELQLRLLDEFWKKPEYSWQGWEKAAPGQKDIYEIKNCYYDWLVEKGFTSGNDKVKYKAAREKTSGLVDMGFIDNEHRLTEVGYRLLELTDNGSFMNIEMLGLSEDSLLYLQQLMKLSCNISGNTVRPFIVVAYLLTELETLSYEEFTYLVPLCINESITSRIVHEIKKLRNGETTIDKILVDTFMQLKNYKLGLKIFLREEKTDELMTWVSMNRKSKDYTNVYLPIYERMKEVYMYNDTDSIVPLFEAIKAFGGGVETKWKRVMFDTALEARVKKDPVGHLKKLSEDVLVSEETFDSFFFTILHLFKIKNTMEDYFDLNRRYLGLSNCFIFSDKEVKMEIVPKHFLKNAVMELYKDAYKVSEVLTVITDFPDICPALSYDEETIINGINYELGTNVEDMTQALNEVDRIRYERFNKLIDTRFTDKTLLRLLGDFRERKDKDICNLVTDNADVPTIFEYILGVIWYKVSGRKGKVLDYLKLSLDANLLPITHAAGGEADLVWEYQKTKDYPAHCLLLEATLADNTNQRRMEMEPVSRHLGNHLLKTQNMNSYCVFATNFLHINVISDFMGRRNLIYCDSNDPDKYISSMKIIPIQTEDLEVIIKKEIRYAELYEKFIKAYMAEERHPQRWYESYIKMS